MKTIKKITLIAGLLIGANLFFSCSDMLDVESKRILFTEDNKLNSVNDLPYSLVGIHSQLQKLGDRYVILGELRGELMDVTPNADMDLQQINNHEITAQNPYASTREYYAVINNCNYFLQHADTTLMSGGIRVSLYDYVLVKAIRAWTYFQLGLNYGKVVYLEQPLLTLEDMQENHPVYDLNQLVDALIAGLLPYVSISETSLMGYNIFTRIPVRFLLGDLYLWKGEYENAANQYYDLIYQEEHVVSGSCSSWRNETFLELPISNWRNIFSSGQEVISSINYSSINDHFSIPNFVLPAMVNTPYEYKLIPSKAAKDLWNNEVYTFYNSTSRLATNINGDLRGIYSSYDFIVDQKGDSVSYIRKYNLEAYVFLYRSTTLYLHYAEAVNQLGKPTLAFAALKYGLKRSSIETYVNEAEITPLPRYCNFTRSFFDDNIAVRAHGLGDTDRDTEHYVFPKDLTNLQDSIDFVDDLICKELALETAFEGNRFYDLMRFANRRNDPAYLADRVARKNPALRDKLMNRENWFLPTK